MEHAANVKGPLTGELSCPPNVNGTGRHRGAQCGCYRTRPGWLCDWCRYPDDIPRQRDKMPAGSKIDLHRILGDQDTQGADALEDADRDNPCREVIAQRNAAFVELGVIARMQGRGAAVARRFLEENGWSDQFNPLPEGRAQIDWGIPTIWDPPGHPPPPLP
jgi:hypothetical protein